MGLGLISQERAREIMGRNMFGVEEAIRHFGVNPTKQQASALSEIPFNKATLKQRRKTHVLAAVFPISILEIRGKAVADQRLFQNQDWYNDESFAEKKGETDLPAGQAGWKLVRKTPVANYKKTPTARVMVYTVIGHFLATGERLFENGYVYCNDLASDCGRVLVGDFGRGGLDISTADGIAAARDVLASSLP